MNQNIVYTADAIAIHEGTDKIVIVERLGSVKGFALPGGKQDPGETLTRTIDREMGEETGLSFVADSVLGTFAEPGRDPRGNYVSTVFIGRASGTVKEEAGKTRLLLIDRAEFEGMKEDFVFDHAEILERYFALGQSRAA